MFCQVLFIQLYESDYECICIVIYGQIRNVPLNILSSVCLLTADYTVKPVLSGHSIKTNYHLMQVKRTGVNID